MLRKRPFVAQVYRSWLSVNWFPKRARSPCRVCIRELVTGSRRAARYGFWGALPYPSPATGGRIRRSPQIVDAERARYLPLLHGVADQQFQAATVLLLAERRGVDVAAQARRRAACFQQSFEVGNRVRIGLRQFLGHY